MAEGQVLDLEASPVGGDLRAQHLACFGEGRVLLIGHDVPLLSAALQNWAADLHAMAHPQIVSSLPAEYLTKVTSFSGWEAMSWPDGAFDSVILHKVIDHMPTGAQGRAAGEAIAKILAALKRISRLGILVVSATHARELVEVAGFAVGLRKARAVMKAITYDEQALSCKPASVFLEPVSAAANERYPLSSLTAARNLHSDMLREAGRRSDGYLARYGDAAAYAADSACDLPAFPVLSVKDPHSAATWDAKPLAEGRRARMARATMYQNIPTCPRPRSRKYLRSPAGTARAFPRNPVSGSRPAPLHSRPG